MKPEDLKFLGFIRYPQTGVGDLWYSSKTFAIRKVGSELRIYILGNVTQGSPIHELTLPDTAPNTNIAAAPLCTYRRSWPDIMAGRMLTGGSAGAYAGGMFWDTSRERAVVVVRRSVRADAVAPDARLHFFQ